MSDFQNLRRTWNLEVFFEGGCGAAPFKNYVEDLEKDLIAFAGETSQPLTNPNIWVERLKKLQSLMSRTSYAGAFANCHSAAVSADLAARQMSGKIRQMSATLANINTAFNTQFLAMSDDEWQAFLSQEELNEIAWNLNERRQRSKSMMGLDMESLQNSLAVNGYHGWGSLYTMIASSLKAKINLDGKEQELSMGQLQNRLSHPDPKIRKMLMETWEKSWESVEDQIAHALNQLSGYRLNLYKHRKWSDFLTEPIEYNRMRATTLETMWSVIDANKDKLVAYLERKKQLLGITEMNWNDVDCSTGASQQKMSYEEAASFIVQHFRNFSPKMADFATMAFNDGWIESEDRPGKRMGGFCSGFSEAKQSRIFVTFSGSMSNVATVAHELGHGYHGWVMKDMAPMTKSYAMVVAETASTMGEMIVANASVTAAKTRDEKIQLMESTLNRAVSLLMNIQSRYLFETEFYTERAKGEVPVKRLNELMIEAQRKAYAGALSGYHPRFWASKLHFYSTGVPFYNFPYTFGYLFSAGVYEKAKELGSAFEERYISLLQDTGRMTVEDLAKKHLGVDLGSRSFWQSAIDSVLNNYDEFMTLTSMDQTKK